MPDTEIVFDDDTEPEGLVVPLVVALPVSVEVTDELNVAGRDVLALLVTV